MTGKNNAEIETTENQHNGKRQPQPNGLLPFRLFDAPLSEDSKRILKIPYHNQEIELSWEDAAALIQFALDQQLPHAEEGNPSEIQAQGDEVTPQPQPHIPPEPLLQQDAAWRRLFLQYPDLRADTLPPEFFQQVDAGEQPTEVYQRLMIDDLKRRLAVAEKNADNRRRAIGSARGDAQEQVRDAFLEGFLSA